ncbi:hypothetical protein SAMN05443667_101260 [Flavobacterium gillisiae]|uniref:ASCH domain-containing protein n=1 Tax=Flavobacterium gillisiae TaxID=150146 RepID=A0A1H3WVH4_9FLAO|nr:hypothetical protein [Flavobacterium gillisiae]SDZ91139.1 hypothetical protein SAMN05443667_101260 [Flavobacterium gillisiae]
MNDLRLPLKKEWFEMTKSGIKTEDYREITPYWANKLLTYFGEKQPKLFWEGYIINSDFNFKNLVFMNKIKIKNNIMTLGYPKSNDSERILKLEHKGIEIREGNPAWGAEQGKLYFVIKHGTLLT